MRTIATLTVGQIQTIVQVLRRVGSSPLLVSKLEEVIETAVNDELELIDDDPEEEED